MASFFFLYLVLSNRFQSDDKDINLFSNKKENYKLFFK
nr:MAG TPA: hypothetical protein [Caudoviricetes sp.]